MNDEIERELKPDWLFKRFKPIYTVGSSSSGSVTSLFFPAVEQDFLYSITYQSRDMTEKPKPLNKFFYLVIIASALFIITIFAMLSNILGDEEAPMTKIIDRYSGYALGVEFVAILIFGTLALILDRREILKEQEEAENENTTEPGESTTTEKQSPSLN